MKRTMRALALAAALGILAAGCGSAAAEPSVSERVDASTERKTAILYTDMSCGDVSLQGELRREHEMPYEGELTGDMLAQGLSDLTGLDFFVTVTDVEDGLAVDWAADSTLIAGLDDREQKEEFHLYDADSLRWFMMDSLWWTLAENLGAEMIYYSAGGEDLHFDELTITNFFPADAPFMGSGFYYGHMDVRGEGMLIDESNAMSLVREAMNRHGRSAPVVVATGEESIGGERCFTYSAGENSADGQKYTALYHYAVSESGSVYYMDVLQGADWIPLDGEEGDDGEAAAREELVTAFADAFFGGVSEPPALHGETEESVLYTFVSADGETRAVEFELDPAAPPEERMYYMEPSGEALVRYRIELGDAPCLLDAAGNRITPDMYP